MNIQDLKSKVPGKLVYLGQFGSHIYGTNVEGSDLDYKGIYVPDAEDILKGTYKDTIHINTNNDNSKNGTNDIDIEIFSVRRFLQLLKDGQTGALDMLFTPEEFILLKGPFWIDLQNHRNLVLNTECSAFIGYCRTQANKYGIKGSRMGSVEDALSILDNMENEDRLNEYPILLDAIATITHCKYIDLFLSGKEGPTSPGIEIVGRKLDLKTNVSYAKGVVKSIYNKYGERAKLAKDNQGIDWKALMHAVRVLYEASELVRTSKITFPRPEAPLLLSIRQGLIPYDEVASIIENGMVRLEEMLKNKSLKPNIWYMDDLLIDTHLATIKELI